MLMLHWFKHWEKVFWIFFALMGLALVVAESARMISVDFFVIMGIFLIVIGSGKLAEEISRRRLMSYHDDTYRKMHQISQNLERTFSIASMHKDKTEFRIQKLDQKRGEMEKKIDKNYRDLARKIIELENRMNKLAKVLGKKRY